LLPGCGGHVVQIVPLAVNGKNKLWKADWGICISVTNWMIDSCCCFS
jgi:hypothetical protein